jgi:hypothetical protein
VDSSRNSSRQNRPSNLVRIGFTDMPCGELSESVLRGVLPGSQPRGIMYGLLRVGSGHP